MTSARYRRTGSGAAATVFLLSSCQGWLFFCFFYQFSGFDFSFRESGRRVILHLFLNGGVYAAAQLRSR